MTSLKYVVFLTTSSPISPIPKDIHPPSSWVTSFIARPNRNFALDFKCLKRSLAGFRVNFEKKLKSKIQIAEKLKKERKYLV